MALLAAFALAAPLVLLTACSQERRPANLLLVTLDTLRADHLGAYGYDRPTSPNLDAFAGRSTLFRDATCSMPTTLPSHLSIFTGLSPRRHGVMRNGTPPTADLLTVFDLLRERGRRTAAVVASGVLAEPFLAHLGFDEVLDRTGGAHEHQIGAAEVTEQALSWLDGRGSSPFALWVHYYDTHEPYAPLPEPLAAFTRGYEGPLGDAVTGRWLNSLNQNGTGELAPRDLRHIVDLYDAEIAGLDKELGRLLAAVEARFENTVVVVVGDHGQALGDQGRYGHGEWLLQPIVQVPFLVRLPGQREGRTVETGVETLDLMPTLCDLFELPTPEGLGGRSLVPALEGRALQQPSKRVVFRRLYEQAPERRGLAVLRGAEKWTLLREPDGDHFHQGRLDGAGGLDGESFFEPGSERARAFTSLAEALTQPPGPLSPLPEETRAMLRSLGYLP